MTTEKIYKIDIDPRILELLGPSLYTNIYYILAELIANAYDANAKNVYIIQTQDSIVVEDDGSGMSYDEGDIEKYLRVAHETRTSDDESYVKGSDQKRRRMGRKGVGKLAALSVSENVEIHTIKHGEKSGFILSRHVSKNHELIPIDDDKVVFQKISENGTSVVMKNPQYTLHKTLEAIKNNLLKIFPLVDDEFKIHIIHGKNTCVIDSFEKEIIRGLGGLIILGDEFLYLKEHFNSELNNREKLEKDLLIAENKFTKKMSLKKRLGETANYELAISGWIGIYRTTRNKKDKTTDFPDNFISLLSNKKLGEYNILPTIGKNALNEVYIVGQLHVELFEETSLPDMALSNRQGYKTEDPRYQEVIKFARELLTQAVNLRAKYSAYKKDEKDKEKHFKDKQREQTLKEQITVFKDKASSSAARKIAGSLADGKISEEEIEKAVMQAINVNLPDMGIKKRIDDAKRKILISHTGIDKRVSDFIYDLLIYNGIPADHIIYTSSDNADSRIPQKTPIFDYLREFFVESFSTEKIYVLYVTSEGMAKSWPAVSEVGAGWIARSNHDIFSINKFKPSQPLDINCEWASIMHDADEITLTKLEMDKVAEKIRYTCNQLGYDAKSKDLLLEEIARKANVIEG